MRSQFRCGLRRVFPGIKPDPPVVALEGEHHCTAHNCSCTAPPAITINIGGIMKRVTCFVEFAAGLPERSEAMLAAICPP
jgi:hypothetical protein